MLTNTHLINVKEGKKIQRRIKIASVKAVTKSCQVDCLEFVIHVENEYDIYLSA